MYTLSLHDALPICIEIFSEENYKKMLLRYFQIGEGVFEQLPDSDSQELILGGFRTGILQLMTAMPEFLELHPDQVDIINKLQKETSVEASFVMSEGIIKLMKDDPQKSAEMQKLAQDVMNTDEREEREEINKKMINIVNEGIKPILPKLKKIIIDGHDKITRVLTEVQKQKIKQVLSETPDYLKKAITKAAKSEGSGLADLNSWVPGTGVPGANPNREQRTPRSRNTERRVPGAN
jgi:hypothetical protein